MENNQIAIFPSPLSLNYTHTPHLIYSQPNPPYSAIHSINSTMISNNLTNKIYYRRVERTAYRISLFYMRDNRNTRVTRANCVPQSLSIQYRFLSVFYTTRIDSRHGRDNMRYNTRCRFRERSCRHRVGICTRNNRNV